MNVDHFFNGKLWVFHIYLSLLYPNGYHIGYE
jgi:hypothetical protein